MIRLLVISAIVFWGFVTHHESQAWVIAIVVAAVLGLLVHDPYPWQRKVQPQPHARIVDASYVGKKTIKQVVVAQEILDPDAVAALQALGYKRAAAIAALTASGWRGARTEERVLNALRAQPPVQ